MYKVKIIPCAVILTLPLLCLSLCGDCRADNHGLPIPPTTSFVPLDFDGDGFSDIGTVIEKTRTTVFSVVLSGNGQTAKQGFSGGKAALGDYDGDGKADFAVVKKVGRKTYSWIVKLSSTDAVTTRNFGTSPALLLTGCRLISANKTSLAVVKRGRVRAIDFDGTSETIINSRRIGRKFQLLGCGDLDGNLIDELIFRKPAAKKSDNIMALGCQNQPITYRNLDRFNTAVVLPRQSGLLPILAFLRNKRSLGTLSVQGVSEVVPFPTIKLSPFSDISGALLKGPQGSAASAVLWREPGLRSVMAIYNGDARQIHQVVHSISRPDEKLIQFQRIIK